MGIADHIKNGISRRGFVLGGAAAGAATVLAGCSKKTGTSDDAAGEPQVIKDDSKIVSITDEYEAVDIDLEPAASWTLPLGTLLYYCDGDYAAAMMAPASALHAMMYEITNCLPFAGTSSSKFPSKSVTVPTVVPFTIIEADRKSTRLNSSHALTSRMPSSA